MHATLVHAVHLKHHFRGPHVDYVGVALAAFVSWVGFSGPGEAALIAAGIGAAHHKVDLSGVLVVAWAGAATGGVVGWVIGWHGGRGLMERPGPFLRMRRRMLRSGDRFYERWGPLAVYFAPTWMAGINRMRVARFLPADVISALVWALLIGLGGYWVGPSIADVIGDLGTYGLIALVVLAIASVVLRVLHNRQKP